MKDLTVDGINELVYAIVMCAIKDYFSANDDLRNSAIEFFNSDYFQLLTNEKIKPKALFERLDKKGYCYAQIISNNHRRLAQNTKRLHI